MSLLSHVYGGAIRARNALYDRGILQARRLESPVISIGNLSVGGSGKTPFVILLGQMLKDRGITFDVLSRGYGRHSCGIRVVDSNGSPREFGDEPLLIARRLGVHVIVGESRHGAGVCAERNFGPCLHLLDDGFQHRALARDFDIVLVTDDDAQNRLLPAGRLREPLGSLRRADAVVLSGDISAERFPAQGKLIWRVRRGIEFSNPPSRPVVFCGIARPQVFISQLQAQGIEPAASRFFRDHHAYDQKDIETLLRLAKENSGAGFITTEKDAINLGELQASLQPLTIVRATMELENAAAVLDTLLRTVAERTPSHEKIP